MGFSRRPLVAHCAGGVSRDESAAHSLASPTASTPNAATVIRSLQPAAWPTWRPTASSRGLSQCAPRARARHAQPDQTVRTFVVNIKCRIKLSIGKFSAQMDRFRSCLTSTRSPSWISSVWVELDSVTWLAVQGRQATEADWRLFSTRRLEPSRTRPSNIIATNLEAVGSQSHSLRQVVRD